MSTFHFDLNVCQMFFYLKLISREKPSTKTTVYQNFYIVSMLNAVMDVEFWFFKIVLFSSLSAIIKAID